jgi:hypothetical protein
LQEVLSCQRKMEPVLPAVVAPEQAEEEVVVGEQGAAEWAGQELVLGRAGTAFVLLVELRLPTNQDPLARASTALSAAQP